MSAHSEVADIVEEDYASGGVWIDGIAEECADNNFRTPRFADDSAAKVIEFAPEALEPTHQIAGSEIGSTGDDNARRFTFCMGVNYFDPSLWRHASMLAHFVYYFGYIYVGKGIFGLLY
jgi:hypothetical protein